MNTPVLFVTACVFKLVGIFACPTTHLLNLTSGCVGWPPLRTPGRVRRHAREEAQTVNAIPHLQLASWSFVPHSGAAVLSAQSWVLWRVSRSSFSLLACGRDLGRASARAHIVLLCASPLCSQPAQRWISRSEWKRHDRFSYFPFRRPPRTAFRLAGPTSAKLREISSGCSWDKSRTLWSRVFWGLESGRWKIRGPLVVKWEQIWRNWSHQHSNVEAVDRRTLAGGVWQRRCRSWRWQL